MQELGMSPEQITSGSSADLSWPVFIILFLFSSFILHLERFWISFCNCREMHWRAPTTSQKVRNRYRIPALPFRPSVLLNSHVESIQLQCFDRQILWHVSAVWRFIYLDRAHRQARPLTGVMYTRPFKEWKSSGTGSQASHISAIALAIVSGYIGGHSIGSPNFNLKICDRPAVSCVLMPEIFTFHSSLAVSESTACASLSIATNSWILSHRHTWRLILASESYQKATGCDTWTLHS